MPIVSNTSPILNLAVVNQLHLLKQQFDELFIPKAVLDELKIHEERPGSQAIREAIASGWIRVQIITNEPLAQLSKANIGSRRS